MITRSIAAAGILLSASLLQGLPVAAQGMRSIAAAEAHQYDVGKLGSLDESQIAVLHRLLERLGLLEATAASGKVDGPTAGALARFQSSIDPGTDTSSFDSLARAMYAAIWEKEGWSNSTAAWREIIVEPEKVKAAQEALNALGYEPGKMDGKFGPATLAAVEKFQSEKGLKIDGLLTRNTYDNVVRGLVLKDANREGTVRILNWPDYIDPDVLEKFEKETRIEVVHDVFENSEEPRSLLLAKSAKYDVVVQSGYQIGLVLQPGVLKELNQAKLPNIANLDPAALRYTDMLDPGNKHSIPYMWGTVGIGVNEDAVKRLAPDVKTNSLSMFLDPKTAQTLSACGLAVVDEPTDVMPALVAYLGGDISKIGIADLEAVEQALAKVAPYITVVTADRFIDELAAGKYCAAIGYSGDVFQARANADSSADVRLAYHVPAEGSQLWFDLLVIPENAPNADAAYRFLDFLMRPDIAAENTNFLHYANPNLASAAYIEAELMSDPGLYPPPEVLARLAVLQPLSNRVDSELQRIWSKLRRSQ